MTYKHWHEKLSFTLWRYHTSIRASTGVTPFSLVYGTEAFLLIELEMPSLKIALDAEIDELEWLKTKYEELVLIDERKLRLPYYVGLTLGTSSNQIR